MEPSTALVARERSRHQESRRILESVLCRGVSNLIIAYQDETCQAIRGDVIEVTTNIIEKMIDLQLSWIERLTAGMMLESTNTFLVNDERRRGLTHMLECLAVACAFVSHGTIVVVFETMQMASKFKRRALRRIVNTLPKFDQRLLLCIAASDTAAIESQIQRSSLSNSWPTIVLLDLVHFQMDRLVRLQAALRNTPFVLGGCLCHDSQFDRHFNGDDCFPRTKTRVLASSQPNVCFWPRVT